MPAFYVLGRILFAILFVVSGVYKLSDISGMAQMVSAHVPIPEQLSPYTAQIEATTKLPIAQLMVIASGTLEVLGGLLIALNFGARVISALLVLFVIATIFYFHDFWNMTGTERVTNLFEALKNLSIIGALFMIIGYPRSIALSQSSSSAYDGV
ncbi:MAG: DoxX family protein [Xanthobacteraceae bacterium]|nr:DoxX family protein [Xanthobacteraceae bacterium]